jgi:hypothetical protein
MGAGHGGATPRYVATGRVGISAENLNAGGGYVNFGISRGEPGDDFIGFDGGDGYDGRV